MRGIGAIVVAVLVLIVALVLANTVLTMLGFFSWLLFGLVERGILFAAAVLAALATFSYAGKGQVRPAALTANVAVLSGWGALVGWSLIGTAILIAICLAAQAVIVGALRPR